jgi:hypothetical protein
MAEVFHRYHAAAANLAFAAFYPKKLGCEFTEIARRFQSGVEFRARRREIETPQT